MRESVVIDTGPLITLARIDALDIIGDMPFCFVCPQEVRDEIDEGIQTGYSNISPSWLKVLPLEKNISPLAVISLDRGEAAVIQLASEQGISRVCIDEWKGRRAALAVGLKVTGVLGILGKAKKIGLIPAIEPFIRKALNAGIRYDVQLVKKVLDAAGE